MGRGDSFDDDLGTLGGGLYSPYQRQILATQRAQDVIGAPNPLYGDSVIVPTAAVEPSAPPARNPLIQPAFPLATMAPEQQLRWQETTQKAQKAQADLDKAAMDAEIARREEAYKVEMIKQSRALIDRSTELDPADLKGYPLARAKLARDFPIGAGTAEVERALKPLDEVHKQAIGYDTWYQKEFEKQGQTEQQKRYDDARKQVAELGPDAIADFYQTQKNEGVDAAIEKVTQVAGRVKQENIIAQLKASGLTDEQIAAKYGGPGNFKYIAAEAEAKAKAAPGAELSRATSNLLQLQKMRNEFKDDPEKWPDQMEEAYNQALANVEQQGARAGIRNYDPAKEKARAGAMNTFWRGVADIVSKTPVPVTTPSPTAVPSDTPVSGALTLTPTPVPTATPVPAPVDPTLRIDRNTGKKYVVGNRTAANPRGEWVEVR